MADPVASPGFFSKGGLGSDLLGYAPLVGGVLSSLFGDSEEEQRRKRRVDLIRQNELYRQRALERAQQLKQGGIKDISKETSTQLGRATSDVARRAAALGRTGDTESMLLPVTSNINEAGGKNLETAIQTYDTGIANIGSQYDQNAMNIESDYAARPIEPDIADQLMGVGSSIIQGNNYDRYLKAMTDINNPNQNVRGLQPWQVQQKPDYSYYSKPSLYR